MHRLGGRHHNGPGLGYGVNHNNYGHSHERHSYYKDGCCCSIF